MGRKRIFTDEERKLRKKEYDAKWYQENRDKILEQKAKWYQENRDKALESQKKYAAWHKKERAEYGTKWRAENPELSRANILVSRYRQSDEKANRGKCTLTARWIVDNIFNKPCHYCGETDWRKMGCDRIDNSLPHTPDNVVPCCYECNFKRHTKSYEEFKKEMES